MLRNFKTLAAGITVLIGFALLAHSLYIPAKAWLSVRLIDCAWEQALAEGNPQKPWPWMDTEPVARLSFPVRGTRLVILRGVSGQALAFAPGWHEFTSPPGQPGVSLIAAHRDTHFRMLEDIEVGERLELETPDGRKISYRVKALQVAAQPRISVSDQTDRNVLVLSTCYPIGNPLPGSPERFLVIAVAENAQTIMAQSSGPSYKSPGTLDPAI